MTPDPAKTPAGGLPGRLSLSLSFLWSLKLAPVSVLLPHPLPCLACDLSTTSSGSEALNCSAKGWGQDGTCIGTPQGMLSGGGWQRPCWAPLWDSGIGTPSLGTWPAATRSCAPLPQTWTGPGTGWPARQRVGHAQCGAELRPCCCSCVCTPPAAISAQQGGFPGLPSGDAQLWKGKVLVSVDG